MDSESSFPAVLFSISLTSLLISGYFLMNSIGEYRQTLNQASKELLNINPKLYQYYKPSRE